MKYITESKMRFGKFDERNLFHIEESQIFKELGEGIKSVEFILRYNKDRVVLLEAKESCPNIANRIESVEREIKFEEYYSSITEKFIDSFEIYIASLMDKYSNTSDIGEELQKVRSLRTIRITCVLVIRSAREEWLAGPMEELRARLFNYRKIWGIEVIVLNEDMAKKYHLIKE